MRKGLNGLLGIIVVLSMLFSLISQSVFSVVAYAQQGESVRIPSPAWSSEEWDDYETEVLRAIPSGKVAAYISLDDKPIENYDFYQCVSSKSSDMSFSDEGSFKKMDTLENYPGVYILDPSIAETFSCVSVYHKGETDIFNGVDQWYFNDFGFSADKLKKISYYTVDFEQGEIDCRDLPVSYICRTGKDIPVKYENSIYSYKGYTVAGYKFYGWADTTGKQISTITKKTTLHPLYISEERNKVNEDDEYRISNAEGVHYFINEWAEKETVNVSTAEELITSLHDDKSTFISINGKISLTKEMEGYTNYFGTPYKGRFHLNNDCILVRNGGELLLDGAIMQREYGYSKGEYSQITVQSGGKLTIKNGSELNYFSIGIQKNAKFIIDDARVSFKSLYNYGTIDIVDTNDTNSADQYSNALTIDPQIYSNEKDSYFFNAESGTININANKILELDGSSFLPNQYVNRGVINVNEASTLCLEGESTTQNEDKMQTTPFVNEGTIKVTVTAPDKNIYLNKLGLHMYYTRLLNKGLIEVMPGEDKWAGSSTKRTYFAVTNSELYNEGTISLDTQDSIGLGVSGVFLDVKQFGTTTSETQNRMGSINNGSNGKIIATAKSGAVALMVGTDNILNNEGSIVIDSEEDTFASSMVTNGIINNKGTISGTGSMNVVYSYSRKEDIIVSGNPVDKQMKFSYYIDVEIRDENDEYDGFLREYTLLLDDKYIYEKTENDSSTIMFTPGTHKIKISAKGYMDCESSIKISNTVSEYVNEYKQCDGQPIFELCTYRSASSPSDKPGETPGTTDKPGTTPGATDKPSETPSATDTPSGTPSQTPTTSAFKVGDKVTDTKSKANYKITSVGKTNTVAYLGTTNKKATSVTVPSTVKIAGKTYKVTSIAANAFKNNKKTTKVTVGSNVAAIGKNAFKGCSKLKTITIKPKKLTAKGISKGAFVGLKKGTTIKVPKSKLKAYKKLFKSKGLSSKVKVK